MIYTADKAGRTDSAYHTIKENLNVNLPIVIVSWVEDFIFNDALLNLKEYVLICFCEYGWNYVIIDSHIWGLNTNKNGYGDGRYKGEEWDKFDNWVRYNPFKIMLKRELLKQDVSDRVQPIEYPCEVTKEYPIQDQQQFNSRPINVLNFWGRSNEVRLKIHADIWYHAFKKGFQPCDNIYYLNSYLQEEKGEKWVTLWIPHYQRVDISEVLNINNFSKLCLSWAGAGFKCFRTAEAPLNSIMVMHRNKFAWTFDWNETNCILVEPDRETEGIEEALQRSDLHEVYLSGVQNANKYRVRNYFTYLETLINNA